MQQIHFMSQPYAKRGLEIVLFNLGPRYTRSAVFKRISSLATFVADEKPE
jgi:hypothetical protein